MDKKIKLPPIGFRIIKSAIAVLLCYLVSILRGDAGIVFYSQLAALWCMQLYIKNSKRMAVQRFIGTVIGAIYGLLVIITTKSENSIIVTFEDLLHALFISGMIVVVLYTTVILKRKEAAYFSCVVFLSIVVNHLGDQNPYFFVWNRFLDTIIGIVIGVFVNYVHLPRYKNRDILFISGMDDTFINSNTNFTDYGRVEINRMLDDGLKFTISTMLTPAALLEPLRDISINIPVIAMDGAVLYNIKDKKYSRTYVISRDKARNLFTFIKENGLKSFSNVIIDDMLVIFYEESDDHVYNELIAKMRRSPYRNYVRRELPQDEEVVYFMLLDKTDKIEMFFDKLIQNEYQKQLKILKYSSTDYPGYSYIKIYNKNATKKNMIEYLKQDIQMEKTVTFGSMEGKCDYIINGGDNNQVIKIIKKIFEPSKLCLRSREK